MFCWMWGQFFFQMIFLVCFTRFPLFPRLNETGHPGNISHRIQSGEESIFLTILLTLQANIFRTLIYAKISFEKSGGFGFYELAKSDFVLFKAYLNLPWTKVINYFTIMVGYKFSVYWKKKSENLTFLVICTQQNWMSTRYFNPRWNLVKASFQHSASAYEIYYIHEGGLSAQCMQALKKMYHFP